VKLSFCYYTRTCWKFYSFKRNFAFFQSTSSVLAVWSETVESWC